MTLRRVQQTLWRAQAMIVSPPDIQEGTTDTESFRAYVQTVLIPTLRTCDLVVLDNLSPLIKATRPWR